MISTDLKVLVIHSKYFDTDVEDTMDDSSREESFTVSTILIGEKILILILFLVIIWYLEI